MRQYTKPALIDKPLISPALNGLARLSEYQPNTRWRPGDPLPKHGQPDAPAALTRNADAFAKVLTFKKRNAPTFDDPTSGLRRAA